MFPFLNNIAINTVLVKELMKSRNTNQARLTQELGISATTLTRVMKGQSRLLSVPVLYAMSKYFNTPMENFIIVKK